MGDDLQRLCAMWRCDRQHRELQLQAFAKVARADAGWIQILQMPQGNVQIVDINVQFRRQHRDQFGEILLQIAIVVQRVDQQRDELLIVRGNLGQRQLGVQVFAQGLRLGRNLGILDFIIVVARSAVAVVFLETRSVGAAMRVAGGRVSVGIIRGGDGCGGLGGARRRRSRLFGQAVLAFEQRIVLQEFLDLLIEFHRRQLQQPD